MRAAIVVVVGSEPRCRDDMFSVEDGGCKVVVRLRALG
jgi:hypothetical protein